MTKLGTPMMIPSITYPPKRSHQPASTADPAVVLMEGPVEYCGGGAPKCMVHCVPSHQRCAGCPDGSGYHPAGGRDGEEGGGGSGDQCTGATLRGRAPARGDCPPP